MAGLLAAARGAGGGGERGRWRRPRGALAAPAVAGTALIILVLSLASLANAKRVHEAVQLTSINTEEYLTKFVVDKGADLTLAVGLHLDDKFWAVGKHALEINVFTEKGNERRNQ